MLKSKKKKAEAKKETKKRVKKYINQLMSENESLNNIAILLGIIRSLTKKERHSMLLRHEIISFNSSIRVYDDILSMVSGDKTQSGKAMLKKILAARNRLVKDMRKFLRHNANVPD